MRLPTWSWFLLAIAALGFTYLTVGGWFMNVWAKQTIQRFVQYAQYGDAANCRSMLAEDHRGYWLLDADKCRRLFVGPPTVEPVSLIDVVRGRQYFRVPRKWVDGYITVERGRVTLDEDFISHEIDPPAFKLTKQVKAMEEYKRCLAGEHNLEEVP